MVRQPGETGIFDKDKETPPMAQRQQQETTLDRIGNTVRNGQPSASDLHQQLAGGRSMVQLRPNDYCTAMLVPQPRDEEDALKRIEAECDADPKAMMYSLPFKKKGGGSEPVEGGTIKFAMMIAREWGNCAASGRLVDENFSTYLFEGVYVDLQTGFNCVRPYRMSKPRGKDNEGTHKMSLERAEDMVFEIGVSKAIRNAVLNGMPARVVQRAMKRVKTALGRQIGGGGQGQGTAFDRLLQSFAAMKVTKDDLVRYLDNKPSKTWTAEDIGTLKVAYDSIVAGELTVEQFRDGIKPQDPPTGETSQPDQQQPTVPESETMAADEDRAAVDLRDRLLQQQQPPPQQNGNGSKPDEPGQQQKPRRRTLFDK